MSSSGTRKGIVSSSEARERDEARAYAIQGRAARDTFARHLSSLKRPEVEGLVIQFHIPLGCRALLPDSKNHACYPPRGYVAISVQHFEQELRFPIQPYLIAFLNKVKLAPFQFTPNFYAQLTSLAIAFLRNGLCPHTSKMIQQFYSFKALSVAKGEKLEGIYYLTAHLSKYKDLLPKGEAKGKSNVGPYKTSWFYVSCPSLADLRHFSFILKPELKMDESPLSSEEERALDKLAISEDVGINSKFDDAVLKAYNLAPPKESPLLRSEEDIGKTSDNPKIPSVFEVLVQVGDTSASQPLQPVSTQAAVAAHSPSPARKASTQGTSARASSKARSSSACTPSKGAYKKTASTAPASARTGSDPAPVAPATQVDSSSSPNHTSTSGVPLPSPARAPAPAPLSERIPANRRKLVLLKSPPASPAVSLAFSTPSMKRPAEALATPTAPSKSSKLSAQDQAPTDAAFSKVLAVTEATASSIAAPSEVPFSNVFTNLQSFPTSSSQPEKCDAPPQVASQATRAGPRQGVTKRFLRVRPTTSCDGERDVPKAERTPSPTRPDVEIGSGGRYLTSFLDNWETIMLTHTNVLENKYLRGEDLDEFVARHSMLSALDAMKRRRQTKATNDAIRKMENELEEAKDLVARLAEGRVQGQEAQIAEANATRKATEEALKKMENEHAMLKDELLKAKEDLKQSEQRAELDEQCASTAEEKIEVLHRQVDAALARVEAAEKQAEEAKKRADEMGAAAKSAEEAATKCAGEVETAAKRAKEAEHRVEVLRQQVREAIQRAETAEQRVEDMKKEAEVVNRHADNAFEELTVFRNQATQELEVRVADARDEAEERTGRDFLYTLWMSHPEMNFSIFGDIGLETVEDFKARATSFTADPIPLYEEPLPGPDPPAQG